MFRIVAVLVVLCAAGGAQADDDDALPRLMTVTGQGAVEMVPDMATVRLGVMTEARGAREAIDDNSRAMAGVLERLKGLGVADRDLQTSEFSVHPRWNRVSGDQAPEVIGFVARNLLSVRVRDLARLGEVLDAVARDGANQFEGLAFGLQNPDPVEDAAREAAVAEARRKAQLYAAAAGVALGPLQSLSESGGVVAPMPMARAEMSMVSEEVPMAAGEVSVSARVTLTYVIE